MALTDPDSNHISITIRYRLLSRSQSQRRNGSFLRWRISNAVEATRPYSSWTKYRSSIRRWYRPTRDYSQQSEENVVSAFSKLRICLSESHRRSHRKRHRLIIAVVSFSQRKICAISSDATIFAVDAEINAEVVPAIVERHSTIAGENLGHWEFCCYP